MPATQSQTQSDNPQQKAGKSGRGFAAMDAAKQRAIASKGGKAAHESGRAHEFTSEEARAAGRKGGEAAHESGRAHEFTSEEARAAGRKGGEASHANRLNRMAATNVGNRFGGESDMAMPVNREPNQQAAPVSAEPITQSDPLVLRESVKPPVSPQPPSNETTDKLDKSN
jgi:general stress protein YciG